MKTYLLSALRSVTVLILIFAMVAPPLVPLVPLVPLAEAGVGTTMTGLS